MQLINSKLTTHFTSDKAVSAYKLNPEDDNQKIDNQDFDLEDISLDLNDFDEEELLEPTDEVSINDGLIMSLRNKCKVDVHYIASISHKTEAEVVKALEGVIFQNPLKCNGEKYEGYEESSNYLSGNLYQKLQDAKKYQALYHFNYKSNIQAIESLLRASIENTNVDDIYVTLGTPWIPATYVRDFIRYLLDHSRYTQYFEVIHDEITGIWEFRNQQVFGWNFNSDVKYGTTRISALDIIKKTLNNQNVVIYDSYEEHNQTKRVVNKEETTVAINKQKEIIERFIKWIWEDKARAQKLKEIYVNKYACIRKRTYNGSFLELEGMNKDIHLFDSQKNAIARILFTPNTLLAHETGAGKTNIMIGAAMELRRLGISKKNMFVVPNNIVGEWKDFFLYMYPNANILVIDPKVFKKEKRNKILLDIKRNDYDGIIIAYSCFELINMSIVTEINQLEEKIDDMYKHLEKNPSKALEKEINNLEKKLEKLKKEKKEMEQNPIKEEDREIYFEELGITRLFVDEAHNFKNVPIKTQDNYVLGINATGSKKCQAMMDKVRFTQVNNHGGVIMATATPITNSITDAYIFQKYLEEGELKLLDISNFDQWVKMFSEKVSEFEIDVDTNSYRLATRFSHFHNIPELTSVFSIVSDFFTMSKDGLPNCDGFKDIVIPKTKEFEKFLGLISERADNVRKHNISRKEDNLLKITTDGRKAALDLRIFSDKYKYSDNCKAYRCSEEVAKLYFETEAQKLTQLIFCDSSTPKEKFNMYNEVKRLLVLRGVKAEEIAFVHDATTEAARSEMFKAIRAGKIRVVIGSTLKLGTGVNIQDRLIAIHHLDIPYRPSDMVQRAGRIIRQGNQNDKIYIYRYITEGSFDAYSWQLLETKQKMIEKLLSGTLYDACISEVSDTVLSYAEVKALAIGNPKLKKRFEIANDLSRTILLNKKEIEKRARLEVELEDDKAYVKALKNEIDCMKVDIVTYRNNKIDYSIKENQERRAYFKERFNDRYNHYLTDNSGNYNFDVNVFKYQGFYIVFPGKKIEEDLSYLGIKSTKKIDMSDIDIDLNEVDENTDSDENNEESIEEEKFIYLKSLGNYKVKLGKSENGYFRRIDNVLEGLEKRLEKAEKEMKAYKERVRLIEEEQKHIIDYGTQIEKIKKELNKIDIELGVVK